MKNTAMDWEEEMERVLAVFRRETKFSLRNIKTALERKGLPFNARFRAYFLERSADR